jgi:hypothetical protein
VNATRKRSDAHEPIDEHDLQTFWQFAADALPLRWLPALGEYHETESTAVRTWRYGLRGVTKGQLRKGMAMLLKREDRFPPTHGEFRALCLHDDAIPPLDEALREAVRAARAGGQFWAAHAWSHAVVYAAAHSVGTWNLNTCTDMFLRRIFANAYQIAVDRWNRGDHTEAPVPVLLTHEKPKRASEEKAAPYIAQLNALFNKHEEPSNDEPERDGQGRADENGRGEGTGTDSRGAGSGTGADPAQAAD